MDLLSKIKADRRFRDPIYGYIWLTEDEVNIIDTPIFQRLRRIQQLALTKYVYPTAEHSRFVHSLGVLQSATNIFQSLFRHNKESLLKIIDTQELVDYFKILRFASLLHDIGHLPFSHGAETAILPEGIQHEDISRFVITRYDPIREIIQKNEINPDLVASMLRTGTHLKKYDIIKKIISGEFDADRADYLLRDSYFCGVAYGNYDYDRYVLSFKVTCSSDSNIILAIDEANIPVIESFLLARFHYIMQVVNHRTRIGFDEVLRRYIRDLLESGRLAKFIKTSDKANIEAIDWNYFINLDDYEIFKFIKNDNINDNKWAKILLRGGHLRPVFNKNMKDKEDEINFKDFINDLQKAKCIRGEDYFIFSKNIKIHELVSESNEVREEIKQERGIIVVDKNGEELGSVVDWSSLIKKFHESPIHILRIYVTEETFPRARECQEQMKRKIKERNSIKI